MNDIRQNGSRQNDSGQNGALPPEQYLTHPIERRTMIDLMDPPNIIPYTWTQKPDPLL